MSKKYCFSVNVYINKPDGNTRYSIPDFILDEAGLDSYFSSTDTESPDQSFLAEFLPLQNILNKWPEIREALKKSNSYNDIQLNSMKTLLERADSIEYFAVSWPCNDPTFGPKWKDDDPFDDVTKEPVDTQPEEPEAPNNSEDKCYKASIVVTFKYKDEDEKLQTKQDTITIFSSANPLPDPIEKSINTVDGIKNYLKTTIGLSDDEASNLLNKISNFKNASNFEITNLDYDQTNFWVEDQSGVACADKDDPESPSPPPPAPQKPEKTTLTIDSGCGNNITVTVDPFDIKLHGDDLKDFTHNAKLDPKTGDYVEDADGNLIYVPVKNMIKKLRLILGPQNQADAGELEAKVKDLFEPDPVKAVSLLDGTGGLTSVPYPTFILVFPKNVVVTQRPDSFSLPLFIDAFVQLRESISIGIIIDYDIINQDGDIVDSSNVLSETLKSDRLYFFDYDLGYENKKTIIHIKNPNITTDFNFKRVQGFLPAGNINQNFFGFKYRLNVDNPSDNPDKLSYHDTIAELWKRNIDDIDPVTLGGFDKNLSQDLLNKITIKIKEAYEKKKKETKTDSCNNLCISRVEIDAHRLIFIDPYNNQEKDTIFK